MNLGWFLGSSPWFNMGSNKDLGMSLKPRNHVLLIQQRSELGRFDIKMWAWSLLSIVPWSINGKDKIKVPTSVNKGLKKHARSGTVARNGSGGDDRLRFRPYVSKVPWHSGARAVLSQFFPRYGHYCGPNWSSGKDGGSLVWDKRPIDWLDNCCYCHDIGYDTHDQAELLKADLAFLECLQRPHMSTKGDANTANVYKMIYAIGLKNMLIPYRTNLVKF